METLTSTTSSGSSPGDKPLSTDNNSGWIGRDARASITRISEHRRSAITDASGLYPASRGPSELRQIFTAGPVY